MSKTPRNSTSRMEGEVIIGVSSGLGTGAVRAIHSLTSRLNSVIEIENSRGESANALDRYDMLLLGVAKGDAVKVRCVGSDARAAFDAVAAILDGQGVDG